MPVKIGTARQTDRALTTSSGHSLPVQKRCRTSAHKPFACPRPGPCLPLPSAFPGGCGCSPTPKHSWSRRTSLVLHGAATGMRRAERCVDWERRRYRRCSRCSRNPRGGMDTKATRRCWPTRWSFRSISRNPWPVAGSVRARQRSVRRPKCLTRIGAVGEKVAQPREAIASQGI